MSFQHWGEFEDLVLDVWGDGYGGFRLDECVFRGQRCAAWPLRSSLERACEAQFPGVELNRQMRMLLFHPRRVSLLERFKSSMKGLRVEREDDHYWAIGQHYGLKTPLLDWTESPFVGTYFALEERNHDASAHALWALDTQRVEERVKADSQAPALTVLRPHMQDHPRLRSQRGVFTVVPMGFTVEEWVRERFAGSTSPVLVKVVLADAMREAAVRSLRAMNLTALTLFPDVEGACRHANALLLS